MGTVYGSGRIDKHPALQDHGGAYVSQWVPELQQLPKKFLHKPWEAPPDVLEAAGVTLGQTYPHRIETEKLEVSKHGISGILALVLHSTLVVERAEPQPCKTLWPHVVELFHHSTACKKHESV